MVNLIRIRTVPLAAGRVEYLSPHGSVGCLQVVGVFLTILLKFTRY